MSRKRLFIVGGDWSYYKPFAEILSLADNFEEADVAMFTGGSDVTPSIYGEKNAGLSHSFLERDQEELEYYKQIVARKMPMIGICRGSQFITAASGGRLFQHVDNHALAGTHPIQTDNGDVLDMSSTHHQMMRPAGNFRIIAWCEHRSPRYLTEKQAFTVKDVDIKVDPEIVFYPDIKALCIQGHPEYLPVNGHTNKYCRKLVEELLL